MLRCFSIAPLSFAVGLAAVATLHVAAGCGSSVVADPASSSGVGGQAASTTSTSGSGGSTPSSTSIASSSATSSGQGGVGGSAPCTGLFESACMAAYPECVPVYDDLCCPMCNPGGGCADCVNIRFIQCQVAKVACDPAAGGCGKVPDWACKGQSPMCSDPTQPCGAKAGCVTATCALNTGCGCTPEQDCSCRAVTAHSCAALCNSAPPPCPAGTIAESDGSCYTGWCIPEAVCAVPG